MTDPTLPSLPQALARANIWLMAGAALSLLAWVLPNRDPPWVSFYNEWAMAVAVWMLAAWQLARSRGPVVVPGTAGVLLAVAALPLLQAAAGVVEQMGDATVAAAMVAGLAAAVVVGRHWCAHAPHEAPSALWTTLLAAGLLSSGLALAQWLRLEGLGVLLADLPAGSRPTGNISQANHLGSLLVWSLLGLWAAVRTGHVRPAWALPTAALLLFCAAATQSRTVWLNLALLALGGLVWRRHLLPTRAGIAALAGLGLWFACLVLAWPSLNAALGQPPGLASDAAMSAGLRPGLWRIAMAAIGDGAWHGWGWTQFSLAQQAQALEMPAVHRVFTYAHNLALDLAIWNGPVPGAVLAGLLAIWCARRARRVVTAPAALAALGIGVLLVHAQVEMPHAYAYFLLPAGLMAGQLLALEARARPPVDGPAARHRTQAVAWLVLALVGGLLVVLLRDYRHIEIRLHQERYRAARVGQPIDTPPPAPWLLTQFEGFWPAMRQRPTAGMGGDELQVLAAAARRFPSGPLQFKLALAQARNGRPLEARHTLALLQAMQRATEADRARAAWQALGADDPAVQAVPWPR
ncbi:MAG: Wzy polymerase domain-containing protein [Aquabacterium sp.]